MKRYVEIITNRGKINKIINSDSIKDIKEKIYKILLTTPGEIYRISLQYLYNQIQRYKHLHLTL